MQKIILFYKFVPVIDPHMTMRWQRELCQRLGLKGRVIVARHGINATLGGRLSNLKTYVKEMNSTDVFKDINYKWSEGNADDFPKLSVKVREELVTLESGEQFDVFNQGMALSPAAWHRYIDEHPDVTILDARNDYESAIGEFKGAVKPRIKAFKQIKSELDKLPKDQPVLTYCTGDVRCEYLSAYMKHKGFKDVYHLDGGIVKYGQKYGDAGHWQGKCYVFDRRISIGFSDNSTDIGSCVLCGGQTSRYINCANKLCNDQILVCEGCSAKTTCPKCARETAVAHGV